MTPAWCAWSSAAPIWLRIESVVGGWQRAAAGDVARQRRPGHELHGEELLAVDHIDFVDGHHVGMAQPSGQPCLAGEAQRELRIGRQVWQDDLQRDEAVERRVVGLVDLGHAAETQALEDLVAAEAPAGGQSRRSWLGQSATRSRIGASILRGSH